MEENKIVKVREQWKQRRSRSTSNLVGASAGASGVTSALKSDTDEGEMNDSDDAQRSFARLTLQTGKPRFGPRTTKNKPLAMTPPNMESDSVNELLSALPHLKSSQQSCRRRRRYKRMAIDCTETETVEDPFKEPYQAQRSNSNFSDGFSRPEASGVTRIENLPIPSTSAGFSSSSHHHHHLKKQKKKTDPGFLPFELDSGKRKRSGRGDKSSDSSSGTFPLTSCPTEFQSMIGIGMDLMNVDAMNEEEDEMMKGDDDDDVSSVSSGTESVAPSCDEGREGDDEQSDWVGDEWRDDISLGESERREFILRRLRDYVPSREIRAGKRRVHPEIPPFSMRTYANEQVSKFLQDPAQSQLRLHPMRREERVQLSHIASLYSLHLQADGNGGCPVLTKTSNTTQVIASCPSDLGTSSRAIPSEHLLLESESDTKRIRKSEHP